MYSNNQGYMTDAQVRQHELLREAQQTSLIRKARCRDTRNNSARILIGVAIESFGRRLQGTES